MRRRCLMRHSVSAKVNQETLAQMVGTTRSRISHFMNKFRERGLVDYTVRTAEHNLAIGLAREPVPWHDRVDVFRTHPLEHVAEQGEQAVRVAARLFLRRGGQDAEVQAEQTSRRQGSRAGYESGADQQGCPQTTG